MFKRQWQGELINYDGIIGRQFLNLERAQYGTNTASHCTGAKIQLIDNVIDTKESIFNPVLNADIRDSARQLYNKIIIKYADTELQYQDNQSITLFGEKIYEVELPLSIDQTVWAQQIAERFINNHKDLHYLINVSANDELDVEIADVVFLQIPDRATLNLPCQIYEVRYDQKQRRVNLTLRTL